MVGISVLKDKFDLLPFNEKTLPLYEALLVLDIADFKPLMEGILTGKIDIEDTRRLFRNDVQFSWFGESDYSETSKLKNPRLSTNIGETLKSNIIARMFGSENQIVKESVITADISDLKKQIADEYKNRTGEEISKEDMSKLLPIVDSELYVELSMNNFNAVKSKDYQLILSDLLSYKVNARI